MADNYRRLVNENIVNYKIMGCNIYLKMNFLQSHLEFISENLGSRNTASFSTRIPRKWKDATRANGVQIC